MRRTLLTFSTLAATALVGLLIGAAPAGAATVSHHRMLGHGRTGGTPPKAHVTSPVPPYTGGYIEYQDRFGNPSHGDVAAVKPTSYLAGPTYGLDFYMKGMVGNGDLYQVDVSLRTSAPVEAGQTYGTGIGGDVILSGAGQFCNSLQAPYQVGIEIDQLTVSGSTITSLAAQVICSAQLTTPVYFYGAAAFNAVPTTPHQGYYTYAWDGFLTPFGNDNYLVYLGDLSEAHINEPIVGMAQTPDGAGYWMVAADGGIFAYGDATFYGSTGAMVLNRKIVGMAATPDGKGYWLVASDGGVFAFGDATFYGSTGNIHLNQPVVGMTATHDGNGYWLVASDGGVFAFGDATFYGSTGNIHLNKPVVGMTPTPDGKGYWFVASDGGIFNYGSATFHGSAGNLTLSRPIVGMSATQDGAGYWLVANDGGIFSYNAPYYGSIPALGGSVDDVVGLSTLPGISV